MATPFIDSAAYINAVVDGQGTNDSFDWEELRTTLFKEDKSQSMKDNYLTKVCNSKKGDGAAENPKIQWGMLADDVKNFIVGGVYTNTGLSVAVAAGDSPVPGDTVYIKDNTTDAGDNLKRLRTNEVITLWDKTNYYGVELIVLQFYWESTPYVRAVVLTTDPKPGGVSVLSNFAASNLQCIKGATAHPAGSKFKPSAMRQPTTHHNFLQILMESMKMTGTKLATKSKFSESNRKLYFDQMLSEYSHQTEMMILKGQRFGPDENTSGIGTGTMSEEAGNFDTTVERFGSGGLFWWLENYELDDSDDPKNILRIPAIQTYDGYDYSGKSWNYHCYRFWSKIATYQAQYGGNERTVLCGRQAMSAILEGLQYGGVRNFDKWEEGKMGFQVRSLQETEITLNFMHYRPFAVTPGWEKSALMIDEDMMQLRYMIGRDIHMIGAANEEEFKNVFMNSPKNATLWEDAQCCGFVSQGGLQVDALGRFMLFHGIGDAFHA